MNGPGLEVEDYYSDGVRRIMEVGGEPVPCFDFDCNGTTALA